VTTEPGRGDPPVLVPVEASHVLAFARALGWPEDLLTADDGSIAPSLPVPPTFTTASAHFDPAFKHRPRSGTAAVDDGGESRPAMGLHAEQHYTYHRPVRVGEHLTLVRSPGARWEKAGRSGPLAFTETIWEYRDVDGEPVVTAKVVSVRKERRTESP